MARGVVALEGDEVRGDLGGAAMGDEPGRPGQPGRFAAHEGAGEGAEGGADDALLRAGEEECVVDGANPAADVGPGVAGVGTPGGGGEEEADAGPGIDCDAAVAQRGDGVLERAAEFAPRWRGG